MEENKVNKVNPYAKDDEWVALNSFKDLYRASDIFTLMCDFGPQTAPLCVIGQYLNYAGNHLLYYISTILQRKVFYPSHRVNSI